MRNTVRNSKGFSLVELIIVIAIMAILSAAIAPALIRYLNKARKADDIAFADSLGSSFMAALNDSESLYDFVTYRVQHEKNGKYVIIGFTGYGNGKEFFTMPHSGADAQMYLEASEESKQILSEVIGKKTKDIPLKFYRKNDLDQWVVAVDRQYNIHIFVCGHLTNGSSWYIKNNNMAPGQNGDYYCYHLWPDVDPKYNKLNTPNDVVKKSN
ncbi:MAG: type II secretion system protein [Eubacterium sp.]|nr:type II secretion system protein [Eubacterium sp.]